jgi:hemerythrin
MNDPKIIWNDAQYGVGVKEIDEQHKHFFDITNSIFDLLDKSSASAGDLILKMTEFGDYAFYHFSTEEAYFRKFSYEDTRSHTEVHDIFRGKISGYINEARKPGADVRDLAYNTASFANNWLSGHIPVMDKKYILCFHKNGLN